MPNSHHSTVFLLTTLVCFALGCGTSHQPVTSHPDASSDDAGTFIQDDDAGAFIRSDAAIAHLDGGPSLALTCRGTPSETSVGLGCFCEGPTVQVGNRLYRVGPELETFDIRDPARPQLVHRAPITLSSTGDIVAIGDRLIVAGSDADIVSISNPDAPVVLGTVPFEGAAVSVASDGRHAFVAVATDFREGELLVIDPTALEIKGRIALNGGLGDVAVVGSYVYIGVRRGSGPFDVERDFVMTIDVDDLAALRVASEVEVSARALLLPTLLVHDETLWVAGGNGTPILEAFELTSATAPRRIGVMTEDAMSDRSVIHGLTASRDVLFVLGSRVDIVDARDRSAPRIAGSITATSDSHYGEFVGDHLLVSSGNALRSIPIECD
jgi:hypothetical protein